MTDDENKANDSLDLLRTGGGIELSADMLRERGVTNDALLGREFSGYKLTGHIADGGMGKVFRASRADGQFDRDVAVKISAVGYLDDALLGRFLLEQQILANLNHRHIAQLYDAGVSDEGWPYIVMELVDGKPIDEYCVELSLKAKIELIMKVCSALSFAHGQLIVHRDVKPGNVLVTDDGEPKLLDFGIAKLTSENAPVTRASSLTPRYASPEQLLGKPAGVTSDVYQAGLLLAEILHPELMARHASLEECIRRASDGEDAELDPAVKRTLPKELVSIVEQCVRSDPAARYQQISDVRADLENFLGGYPVNASGNSAGYRARKFVRRNLPLLSTGAVAMAAFVVSGTWYLTQVNAARDQAELEAATSQQVTDFLAGLFRSSSPSEMQGADITAGELLTRGLERLDENLGDQPRVHAQLQSVLGSVYRDIGDFETARDLVTQALDVQGRELGTANPAYAQTLKNLAAIAAAEGSLEEADRLYRQVIDLQSEILGPTEPETLDSRSRLGAVLRNQGLFAEAVALQAEIVDGYRRAGELESSQGIGAMTRLAVATFQAGDPLGAIPYFEQTLDLSREHLGERHAMTLSAAKNMAVVYQETGQPEKSVAFAREAYELTLQVYGAEHAATVNAAVVVSNGLRQVGRHEDARPYAEQAYDAAMLHLPRSHSSTDQAISEMGLLEFASGNFARAESLYRELLEIEREHLGVSHMYTIGTQLKLADAVAEQARTDEAVTLVQQAVDLMHETQGPDHHETLLAEKQLASLLIAIDKLVEAKTLLDRVLPGLIEHLGDDANQVQDTRAMLADIEARNAG